MHMKFKLEEYTFLCDTLPAEVCQEIQAAITAGNERAAVAALERFASELIKQGERIQEIALELRNRHPYNTGR